MSKTERGTKSTTSSVQVKSLQATQVPLGISLVYYSLALMLLAIIGLFVAPMVLSGNPILALRAMIGMGFLIIVASILSLLGTALCLTAPNEMPGKGAIYLTCGLDAAAILINVASHFTTLPRLIVASSNLPAIAGFVCFLIFLKHLGGFMCNSDLTSQAARALKLGIACVVFMVLSVILGYAMPPAPFSSPVRQIPGMMLSVLGAGCGLVAFLRYVRLLHDLRQAFARS